ncbi:uncharacterized protein LOC117109587 [Anneissia japonica]|uniref:uncharacterized protein LOC117109587 n=1 Tax=Anneissia japonica TaxID=1529436 RepID=UPI0014255D6F|nr:uncharacterized protein LOC117109587 [Anneissia japonica]
MGRHFTSQRNFQHETSQRYFQEARDVIDSAKKKFEIAACVIAQEAVLYREQGNTEEELKCLDYVIDKKPSNVGARIQKAQALLGTQRQREGFAMYKNLLHNFKDPFDQFDINRNYASSMAVKKQFEEAYDKNYACLEIALSSFVIENSSEQAEKEVKFIEEEEEQVQKVIGHIEKYFHLMKKRSKKISKRINPTLELAKIHEKIGRYKDTCSEYNEALYCLLAGENHDRNQEIDIRLKLTNVYIKLGDLSNAEKMLEEIKDAEEKHEDNINKLQIDLAVAKGEKAAKSGEHTKAIDHFACAAKMGSVEGAMRLFREIKEETNHQDFIKYCALVKKFIMATSENGSMLNDLNELLVRSYDDGCLMHVDLQKIRECQLEMEYGYLLKIENTGNIDNVIHKCRSSLNHAMTRFKNDNYPRAKSKNIPKDNTDFFIVNKDAENEIVKKITVKYGWTDFPTKFKEFLDFLVSIQPVTNPKYNWIEKLIELDNVEKHSHSPRDADKSFFVARSACTDIRPILEEFCKYFKQQPTSPSH